jgi:hypothetical protein
MITANTFRRNPAVEEAPLQGELMLFDPSSAKFFVLNRTMAYLWRGCDGERTLSELVGNAANEFSDVDPVRMETDFSKAIEDLLSLGLLVESEHV